MYPRNINYSVIGLNHEYLYKRADRSGLKGNLKCRILVNISNTVFRVSNWFYISRAFFIPNCILYLKNILYNCVFRAAQIFLVHIKTNWFIIIRVAQGFRVVQYFLDFSET